MNKHVYFLTKNTDVNEYFILVAEKFIINYVKTIKVRQTCQKNLVQVKEIIHQEVLTNTSRKLSNLIDESIDSCEPKMN